MKYMKQFGIILGVTCVGEILKYFINLPIPASIYGLVLMLVLLGTKCIDVEQVKDVGEFLIEIMSLMFIPAGVGLIEAWSAVKDMLLPICVITAFSTILVMSVSGKVVDHILEKRKKV